MWATDRFNPFFSLFWGIKEALLGEILGNIKNFFYPPLSIFVTFRALAPAELWFNVICHKAKIVNALMLHYPRQNSTGTVLVPDDSAIAGAWQR